MADLGLFPLDLVLLPGERVPLHIFEPRYRELIGQCLDTATEFGLIYSQGPGLSTVGTRARVEEVLQRFPDGRFNVVVAGTSRFRLVGRTTGRSYITARVGDVEDRYDPPSEAEAAACVEAFARILLAAESSDIDAGPDGMAFEIAGRADLPNPLKQELLEMRSERERILLLTEALNGPAGEDLRTREIERRAAGNGHVEHR